MPPSEWTPFLRALSLLKRLQQSPAPAGTLMDYVESSIPGAYPPEPRARLAAFKHDREHLRNRLDVCFQYDARTQLYSLTNPGPFGMLELDEESLRGLGVLGRDFGNGLGERVYIRALLNNLKRRLTPETQRLLDRHPESLVMGLRQFVDKGHVASRVWETVQKAVDARRKLSFNHLSPRYMDGLPTYFEIAPVQMIYQDGLWYLRGWVLERQQLRPNLGSSDYLKFRLTYIQDDEELKLWPTVYPARYRTPPRFNIHYLLMPEIGRGEISHHFAETHITRLPDGQAEVHGVSEDVWEAARLLLGYGEGCIVLGGEELLKEMRRRVEGMARNYGFF
ncbi:MAG: WYL domain-containing protein [Chloroflexota bacterium]